MKKLIILGIAFTLFIASASAQNVRDGGKRDKTPNGFNSHQLTRGEKFKLNKNDARYKRTQHRVRHDGRVTHGEKRKLNKMRKHDRHETYRFKHNRHTRKF